MANSRCTSLSDNAEVGSSMTTSLASIDSARAISTICCSATRQIGHQASRVDVEADRAASSPCAVQLAPVDGPPRTGSRPMKTFSATDSVGIRLNSW